MLVVARVSDERKALANWARHTRRLVGTHVRLIDEQSAWGTARKVVVPRLDRGAVRGVPASPSATDEEFRATTSPRVEVWLGGRSEAVQTIEVELGTAEVLRGQRIDDRFGEWRQVERNVVVYEVPKLGVARRHSRVVTSEI